MVRTRLAMAIAVGDIPPSEFLLFRAGVNKTEKGEFVFDRVAAREVMAADRAWGVDHMIDLEHQSLDGHGADPTDRDARGWFRLELRPDGSLWAVDVKWTPDGAARLADKRQRYISPAFDVDPKTKRIVKVVNAAITSIPATHHAPPLVAASVKGKNAWIRNSLSRPSTRSKPAMQRPQFRF